VAHSRFWFIPGALKNAVEAYVQPERGLFTDTGEVTGENGPVSCATTFLRDYMAEFREFIVRVLTVLPRQARREAHADRAVNTMNAVEGGRVSRRLGWRTPPRARPRLDPA
jgi:hypothetical protein